MPRLIGTLCAGALALVLYAAAARAATFTAACTGTTGDVASLGN